MFAEDVSVRVKKSVILYYKVETANLIGDLSAKCNSCLGLQTFRITQGTFSNSATDAHNTLSPCGSGRILMFLKNYLGNGSCMSLAFTSSIVHTPYNLPNLR